MRSCVGCGAIRAKRELIRLYASEGWILEIDLEAVKQGRGVYLCPRSSCVHEAVKRDAFSRSLKVAITDIQAEALEKKILSALIEEFDKLTPDEEGFSPAAQNINRIDSAPDEKKGSRRTELWYKYQSMSNNNTILNKGRVRPR